MPHFSNYSNRSTNFATDKVNIIGFHDSSESIIIIPKYLTKSFMSKITRVFKVELKILIRRMNSGTAEGEGLVGPRPHHFFASSPPLFALKRKII